MFTRIFQKSLIRLFGVFRELVLILAVGVLGSQLLISLNGGAPIGVRAEAASETNQRAGVHISSINYEINSVAPTELRGVRLTVASPGGASLQALEIAMSPDYTQKYACRSEGAGVWNCPTPGFKVNALEGLIAVGS